MSKDDVNGTLPLLFAACDEVYFRKHAEAFCRSGLSAGHELHILVSPPPGPDLARRAATLSDNLLPPFLVRFDAQARKRLTVEVVADKRAEAAMTPGESVVFYQSLRFHFLPALLARYRRPIIVLDIDSLVRRPIKARPDADLGLYLRLDNQDGRNEDERLGMKILGAMVYAAPASAEYFRKVSAYLDSSLRRTFIDQRALYETYLAEPDLRVFDIAKAGWLDWSFAPETPVWTAKGKRNRRNVRYIRERLKFENRNAFCSSIMLVGYRLGLIRS